MKKTNKNQDNKSWHQIDTTDSASFLYFRQGFVFTVMLAKYNFGSNILIKFPPPQWLMKNVKFTPDNRLNCFKTNIAETFQNPPYEGWRRFMWGCHCCEIMSNRERLLVDWLSWLVISQVTSSHISSYHDIRIWGAGYLLARGLSPVRQRP